MIGRQNAGSDWRGIRTLSSHGQLQELSSVGCEQSEFLFFLWLWKQSQPFSLFPDSALGAQCLSFKTVPLSGLSCLGFPVGFTSGDVTFGGDRVNL